MDLINKIKNTRKEIDLLEEKLEKLEIELYHENKKIVRICEHKKVYKYILKNTEIYTCKYCKNNLEEEKLNKSIIIVRLFNKFFPRIR